MLPPLARVLLAAQSVLYAFLVDGARLRFLRHVWIGIAGAANDHHCTATTWCPRSTRRPCSRCVVTGTTLSQRTDHF